MSRRSFEHLGRHLFLSLALVVTAAPAAVSQTSTGSIRGYVTDSGGTPIAGARVVAVNPLTSTQREVATQNNGFYAMLGLVPAEYDVTVRQIGMAPQKVHVRVLIGEVFPLDFKLGASAIQVEGVSVVAAATGVEMRTSEVATNVTQQQINNLPTSNRNIFDLAALAPGVVTQNDQINSTQKRFVAGASGAGATPAYGPDQINVFVDGASYKSDIMRGGVVGQDRTRGNLFPRNSVQEFRVITQNYKAEYQKASSGIIVATTKSGGNTWQGNAFFTFQDKGLVAADSIVKARQGASYAKPDYTRYLVGLSGGGPIIRDRLHLFVSYEGNYQDRSSVVSITPPAGYPALTPYNFAQYNGNFASPFRESLFFGKLTYDATPTSSLELSVDERHNSDIRDFGNLFSSAGPDHAFTIASRLNVDTYTGRAKYSMFKGPWLDETLVSFQRSRDQSRPDNPGSITQFFCCNFTAWFGSDPSIQDFVQKRAAIRNDLTYSGFNKGGQHVIKTGVSVDFLTYDVLKRNSENPLFVTTDADSFHVPEHLEFQLRDPNYNTSNTEIGAYLQDDWNLTPRLTFNVGVRWDYESNMLNYGYVTPRDVHDSLTKYAALLFQPLDTMRYFTDGTRRSRFLGAFQPRLGFSYQIDKVGNTTVYGGWGIFYDRTVYDLTSQEQEALQHPSYRLNFKRFPADSNNPNLVAWDPAYLSETPAQILAAVGTQANARQIKLVPNDLRPPKSYHFSLGVRRLLGSWAVQAAYNAERTNNVFTFTWANVDFPCGNGGCGTTHTIPGFSDILIATTNGKVWYDALAVRVDRPYRRSSERFGWGAGLAYTYAKRQTQGFNDDFTYPNARFYPKQPRNDERSHVVANWILDMPYAFGIQFSGLITLGSGLKYDIGDLFSAPGNPPPQLGGFTPPKSSFIIPNAWAFRDVDIRLRKDFPPFSGTTLGVTVDLFNVFNYRNLGCFNTFRPSDANFGEASCLVADPRRLQIGAEYGF